MFLAEKGAAGQISLRNTAKHESSSSHLYFGSKTANAIGQIR